MVPSDPSAVSRDAVVGAVPPDHPRQMGVLFPERAVQIAPTPLGHGGQRACVTVFRRYLSDDVLAFLDWPHTWVKPRKLNVVPTVAG